MKLLSFLNNAWAFVEGAVTSRGSQDAGRFPVLKADGTLDSTFFGNGIGPDTKTRTASENISANALVNFYNDANGAPMMRNADASTAAKAANGYVLSAVATGAQVKAYRSGFIPQDGLTTGATYYLSTTPGKISATAPDPDKAASAGQVVQQVGVAWAADTLAFSWQPAIVILAAA